MENVLGLGGEMFETLCVLASGPEVFLTRDLILVTRLMTLDLRPET